MTKIFLLMWLSDIASAITVLGAIATVTLVIGLLIATVWSVMDHETDMLKAWFKALAYLGPIVLVCGLVPAQSTIRLLAVAEATEVAANTQLGAKSLDALNAVLDKVIKESKK